jgi:hypothetical protein
MQGVRCRVLFPIVFGCIAGALIFWEVHNERIIEAMGMRWDMGPPFWPYQASWVLLQGINAPAYLLDMPVFILFGLKSGHAKLLVEFPTILAWWWFIGWRFDLGLVPRGSVRYPKLYGVGLFGIAVTFGSLIAVIVIDEVRFWLEYGHIVHGGLILRYLRYSGFLCWCLLLGSWSAVSAFRYTRTGKHEADTALRGHN